MIDIAGQHDPDLVAMPGRKRGRDDGLTSGGEESQPKRSSSRQGNRAGYIYFIIEKYR